MKNTIMARVNLPKWELDLAHILRIFVCVLTFLGAMVIIGMRPRESQQFIYMLFCICAFSLLIDNIWITLFVLWSVFLYSFFKFSSGDVYIGNLLYGMILYFVAKQVFKKEHINMFINAVLLYVAANLFYSIIQISGFDFMYMTVYGDTNYTPFGFMANKGIVGILYAMAVPLLATRTKWWYGLLLFIPLFFALSTINIIASCVSLLFVMCFRVRKIFVVIALVLLIALGFIYTKFDRVGTERFGIWSLTMQDAAKHPITGWGLDSFRNLTINKKFLYGDNIDQSVTGWDNPHNFIVSLCYEWGIFGPLIFLGYMVMIFRLFKNSIKTPNMIGLAGAIVAFLVVSMAHFPMFLSRIAVIVIPTFALFEVEAK